MEGTGFRVVFGLCSGTKFGCELGEELGSEATAADSIPAMQGISVEVNLGVIAGGNRAYEPCQHRF
jgi:hypothetical protein